MDERVKMLTNFYDSSNEDSRLPGSEHGRLEFLTTMQYIHRFAPEKAKMLEVGAGTGRYSIALAKEGFNVTAVELVQSNLEVLQSNAQGLSNLSAYQGDALDLSRFQDGTFDCVLLLGPLYHLYEPADVQKCLSEAIRVTRPGGVILAAFLSVYSIILNNYLLEPLAQGIAFNFDEQYKPRHFEKQLFTGYDISEFESLWDGQDVDRLLTVGTDSVLEFAGRQKNFSLTEEDFQAFANLHLATCEQRELLGYSSHLLSVFRKR